MFKAFKDWLERRKQERLESVQFEKRIIVRWNDQSISATYESGEIQSIDWADIRCIAIETNDTGPWGADLWWLLEGDSHKCIYPGGATGDIEALTEFQSRFTGFDDQMVINANGCTSNARFVCWQHDA